MKIVLAVNGTRGDVFPMLALGRQFVDAGHAVVVCAPPDFANDAAERGLSFEPVGRSVRAFMDEAAASLASGPMATLGEVKRYLNEIVAEQFDAIPELSRDADQIFGAGVELAGASAAELHGIPHRYVVYCAGLMPSAEHPPVTLPVESLPRWLNTAAWWLTRGLMNGWARPKINAQRARFGLPRIRDAFAHLLGDQPIVAVDSDLAPLPSDTAFTATAIPCLHPLEPAPLPVKLEDFLAAGPPPVYIGFGSMPDPEPAQTTRMLTEAVEAAGCRALLSRGWAGLADGPLPEGVMAVGSVSHAALFPRVGGIVHHGGAGTTHSAARAGVPQMVVPHLADQSYWAHRVRVLGIGPPAIQRRHLTTATLADGLRELLENELVAERASEVGRRTRERAAAPLDLDMLIGGPRQA